MVSERVQRQIDRLLDEAEQASENEDWATVANRAHWALDLDPDSQGVRASPISHREHSRASWSTSSAGWSCRVRNGDFQGFSDPTLDS